MDVARETRTAGTPCIVAFDNGHFDVAEEIAPLLVLLQGHATPLRSEWSLPYEQSLQAGHGRALPGLT